MKIKIKFQIKLKNKNKKSKKNGITNMKILPHVIFKYNSIIK